MGGELTKIFQIKSYMYILTHWWEASTHCSKSIIRHLYHIIKIKLIFKINYLPYEIITGKN